MNLPVKTKQELISRIQSSQEKIRSFGVVRIGIFGSFVRNEAKEGSDVDFFIEIAPQHKTFKNFMRLGDLLEEITGRRVEMITPQSLNKYTGKHIVREVEYVALAA